MSSADFGHLGAAVAAALAAWATADFGLWTLECVLRGNVGIHRAPKAIQVDGSVDCVVGCDGVGGVVGSGTCCTSFLLDTLHLPRRSFLSLRDGLSSDQKKCYLFDFGVIGCRTDFDIGGGPSP